MQKEPEGLLIERRKFLGYGATAAAGIVLAGWGIRGTDTAYAAQTKTLTIIHTNDIHGYANILPYVKTLADTYTATKEKVVVVSAGDDFSGASFADLSAGQDMADVMNLVGYTMATIGNNEYYMKPAALKAVFEKLNYPLVACNPLPSTAQDFPAIYPYRVVDLDGIKIAFIGIAYNQPGAPDMIASINAARQTAMDSDGAEVFIGVAHLGLDELPETNRSLYVAEQCPWLTAIIDGHSHTELPDGRVHNGVLISQVGCYDANIGVTEITLDDARDVVGAQAELIRVKGYEDTCGIAPDATVAALIAEVNERNAAYVEEIVFTLPEKLVGTSAYVRTQETNFGNLAADAMRLTTGTDIAILYGASIRNDLEAGPVKRGDLDTALQGESLLSVFELSGEELLKILEEGFSSHPVLNFFFPHQSGMRVVFDTSRPAGSKVVYAALLDGSVIDPAKTYSCTLRENQVLRYYSYIDRLRKDDENYLDGVDYTTGFGGHLAAIIKRVNQDDPGFGTDGRTRLGNASYTISFDENGAPKGSLDPITAEYGEEVILSSGSFVWPGYRLGGWLDDRGMQYEIGKAYTNIDYAGAGEITLKAQWNTLEPTLSLAKDSFVRGETVAITGSDFEPDTNVVLTVHSTPVQVATLVAQSNGSIAGSFVIPQNASLGTHSLVAENGIHTATISLKITSGIETGNATIPGKNATGTVSTGDDGRKTVAAASVVAAAALGATMYAAKKASTEE